MPEEPQSAQRDLSALRIHREPIPNGRPRRRWGRWTTLLLVIGGMAGIGTQFWTPWKQQPAPLNSPVLPATPPSTQGVIIQASGYLVPRNRHEVAAKILGVITWVGFEEGDHVKEGQVLVKLEDRDLQARLAEIESMHAQARRELQRLEGLDERARPLADLDKARAEFDRTRAVVEQAKAALDYTFLRAPKDGIVISKRADVGMTVGPMGPTGVGASSLAVILDPSSLRAEVEVNEQHIHRLKKQQPAELTVEAVPGHTYHGKIETIVPAVDRQKAIVRVKVEIVDGDDRLFPDMAVRATFLEKEENP